MSTVPSPDHPHQSDTTAHTPAAAAAIQEHASLPLAIVVLGVAVYLTHGILTMEVTASASPPGPKLFPIIVTVVAYAVAASLIAQWVRGRGARATQAAKTTDEATPAADEEVTIDWLHVGIVCGVFIVFMIILQPVGWLISAALLFTGVAFGLGSRNHAVNLGAGLALSSFIQLAFSGGLGLPLPAGILGAF